MPLIFIFKIFIQMAPTKQNYENIGNDFSERACQTLMQHIHETHSVFDWAHHMGISRAHFCRIIKTETGKTPSDCMADIRFHKCNQLLKRDSRYSASFIAEELGIRNAKSLCGYIQRHYNTTLTQLRKNAQSHKP